jgi:hypothetical protein
MAWGRWGQTKSARVPGAGRMGTSSNLRYMDITPPVGWTWNLPFTIEQAGRNFRVKAGWTINQNAPTGKAYYVSTTGNDTNDGLTAGAPLRKIVTALEKADVDEVRLVDGGAYGYTNGWNTRDHSRSVSVIATGGRVQIGPWCEDAITWASNAPTYINNYTATVALAVGQVLDTKYTDAHGDYVKLVSRATSTLVNDNPGSFRVGGAGETTVIIHLQDGRAPDDFVKVIYKTVGFSAKVSGAITAYFEGVDFMGDPMIPTSAAGPLIPTVYFNNCTFKYSRTNGLSSLGAVVYAKDCIASANVDDGFNYHIGPDAAPKACEINCIGRDNGAAGDADNGSTIHDAGSMLRIMGEYMRNVGRNVHDVTPGTKSWDLGGSAHHSTSVAVPTSAGVGVGGTGGEAWFDCWNFYGSTNAFEVDAGATVHLRNCTLEGEIIGTGTVDYY